MNLLFPSNLDGYLSIFMVFLRLLGLFLLIPLFSHRAIPMLFKVLLAVVFSLAIFPVVKSVLLPVPSDVLGIALYALRETAIGFLMGLVGYLTYESISLAAQFIGYQIGFGSVGLMDPVTQADVSVLVPFTGWVALMVFFLFDMHHYILHLFVRSFEVTSGTSLSKAVGSNVFALITASSARLFVIAIKIAAPITVLVLASNVTIGILSRVLPQMHVILFAFPITILMGLGTLYLLTPNLIAIIENILELMWSDLVVLVKNL